MVEDAEGDGLTVTVLVRSCSFEAADNRFCGVVKAWIWTFSLAIDMIVLLVCTGTGSIISNNYDLCILQFLSCEIME